MLNLKKHSTLLSNHDAWEASRHIYWLIDDFITYIKSDYTFLTFRIPHPWYLDWIFIAIVFGTLVAIYA